MGSILLLGENRDGENRDSAHYFVLHRSRFSLPFMLSPHHYRQADADDACNKAHPQGYGNTSGDYVHLKNKP
jgi:hypothetical protein